MWEPRTRFVGPVTIEQIRVLEYIGDRLVRVQELDPNQRVIAGNLLRAGVLTGVSSASRGFDHHPDHGALGILLLTP